MARIETDPNYSTPTFSRATAATDPFKKEDVQNLAAAMSTHDHTTGKGAPLVAGSIPAGSITSAMIADLTVDTADLKDGAVTSAKILDGTIATGDLANSAVTNAKLGTDTARANLLTNGGFEIWQRGNGPFTTTGSYTADRWQIGLGSGSISVSADGNATRGVYCLTATYTHAGTASNIQQDFKGNDVYQLRNRSLAFSAYVRANAANAARLGIYDSSTSTWTYSTYHSGGGAWEQLTVVVAIGNALTQVSVTFNLNATVTASIDGAMLVNGAQPSDWMPLHPADDLARCLRYYEIIGESTNSVMVAENNPVAGGNIRRTIGYKARKAVTPTFTKVGTWTVSNSSQPISAGTGVDSVMLQITATAAGDAIAYNSGAGQYISLEANP